MKKDNFFSFSDFIKENKIDKSEKELNPYSSFSIEKSEETVEEDPIIEEEEVLIKESVQQEDLNSNFYPLYKDKPEIFSCDIQIEGAKTDETISRLIVESDDWTLMFPGEIKDGKCVIPIRKLNLFEEGQTGKIRLEVIAEGSMFVPWEDDFKIKLSKKVTVSMNETKKVPIKTQPSVGVRVNVRK